MALFDGMTDEQIACLLVGKSKFLSFILRHRPERVGLKLGNGGWVEIDALLSAIAAHGEPMEREVLLEIVRTNSKKRFSISDDGKRIRASQGHSVSVDLKLARRKPPATLFHGTGERFVDSIRRKGLMKMRRHHVHLSGDAGTARDVGMRHGRPVVLTVDGAAMDRDGYAFFLSDNGVWLVDRVPRPYLGFPGDASSESQRSLRH